MSDQTSPSPPTIVPRWEWRTFGEPLDSAERLLADFEMQSDNVSDEIYMLSLHSEASVKVRDDLMDVKHLRAAEDGLELWVPVMKGEFPLSAGDVGEGMSTLGAAAGTLTRERYTLDELIAELIEPNPDLHAARVHKRRLRYVIDECMVELTDITADGTPSRTVAAESPDTALVKATVDKLGLRDRRNVCVAKGLKAMLGIGAQVFG